MTTRTFTAVEKDITPERIEALRRSAQPGHYADCVYAADEPVCACWMECADGLTETLAALTAASEREAALREENERLKEKIKWFNVELSKCDADRECRECGYMRPR